MRAHLSTQAYITDMEQLDRKAMFVRIGVFSLFQSGGNVLGSLIIGKLDKSLPPLVLFALLFAVWLTAAVHTAYTFVRMADILVLCTQCPT